MVSLKLIVVLLLIIVATDARRPRKPRRKTKLNVEVLSKSHNTATARFPQFKRVGKYFVSITIKFLADGSSDYVTNIKRSDRASDGFYYIDANNTLQPGKTYEIAVHNSRKMNTLGTADFFTDCDEYAYQCEADWGQTCVPPEDLCNGVATCSDESDEERSEDGSCGISLPERPTPPPPPADAPCILALIAAQKSLDSKLPECGPDGNYAVMSCGGDAEFSCHCLHPLTGEILHTQHDFHPFVHWNYHEECEERRTAAVDGEGED